jgi:predicted small metal-binding protein
VRRTASFRCGDIGMKCDFEAIARTEEEPMKKIADHAGKVHGMKTVPSDVMKKIKKAIKK